MRPHVFATKIELPAGCGKLILKRRYNKYVNMCACYWQVCSYRPEMIPEKNSNIITDTPNCFFPELVIVKKYFSCVTSYFTTLYQQGRLCTVERHDTLIANDKT